MDDKGIAQPVITTEGVVLARNGKRFARLPDIALAPGQSLAVTGPSGSGKSTALLALAGVRAPFAGTITIEGLDLWKLGRSARDGFRGRRIGLVFQSHHLVDALTVAANVRLAAQCAGHPFYQPGRLEAMLEHLGLSSIRNQRADRISQGQAQRVAVARALLNRPAIVLADEPTSALDDDNCHRLMALLAQTAAAEKAALIIATHDRRVLGAVARTIEMEATQ
jgi:putative ABC transport system ATP-binding protein